VILASRTSISNLGALKASGGNGADQTCCNAAAGGGGGGGIIHLIGPALSLGSANVSGGLGATHPAPGNPGWGGSRAGSCGGTGGFFDSATGTGQAGGAGYVLPRSPLNRRRCSCHESAKTVNSASAVNRVEKSLKQLSEIEMHFTLTVCRHLGPWYRWSRATDPLVGQHLAIAD
jgi:hypothetical protein